MWCSKMKTTLSTVPITEKMLQSRFFANDGDNVDDNVWPVSVVVIPSNEGDSSTHCTLCVSFQPQCVAKL